MNGHDHSYANAERSAVKCQPERVVSRRGGNNATRAFGFAKTQERVPGASFLEGAGALQIVTLQPHPHTGLFRNGHGLPARRWADAATEAETCLLNILELQERRFHFGK
jgi:hypothetical protein